MSERRVARPFHPSYRRSRLPLPPRRIRFRGLCLCRILQGIARQENQREDRFVRLVVSECPFDIPSGTGVPPETAWSPALLVTTNAVSAKRSTEGLQQKAVFTAEPEKFQTLKETVPLMLTARLAAFTFGDDVSTFFGANTTGNSELRMRQVIKFDALTSGDAGAQSIGLPGDEPDTGGAGVRNHVSDAGYTSKCRNWMNWTVNTGALP